MVGFERYAHGLLAGQQRDAQGLEPARGYPVVGGELHLFESFGGVAGVWPTGEGADLGKEDDSSESHFEAENN